MGSIGMPEIILIFLVVLLVFGAKRIPEIARGLGKGIREFKDATTDIKRELEINDNNRYRIQTPQQGTSTPRTDTYPTAQPTPAPTESAATQQSNPADTEKRD